MTDDRAAKIEAMAKAMYEYGARHSWEEVAEVWREPYRQRAAAALDALAPWSLDALLGLNSATLNYQPGEYIDTPDGPTGPWMEPYYMAEVSTDAGHFDGYGENHEAALRNAVAQATTTQEGASNG